MLTFKRDTTNPPAPSTWDYTEHNKPASGRPFLDHSVALCTCPNGHTCSLSNGVHTILDEDGRLSPSYVCPVQGCGFHDWVRLEGWSWAWYNMNCAPDRP
jgi:hypothetical protein